MASFKTHLTNFKNISRMSASCPSFTRPRPRTNLLAVSLVLLSLLFLSSSVTSRYTASFTASAFASRFLSVASYISPFSSITDSKSSTCLVTEFKDNCTLSSIAEMERARRNSRKERNDVIAELSSCDLFDGNWIIGDSDPIYQPGSCPYVDVSFNCFKNGRPDSDYFNYRWKPYGCQIPRFDGRKMLRMLRGKRLVFVGDSQSRNMWESLVCALRGSLENKSGILEVAGRHQPKTRRSYSFNFMDYGCSIDFIRSSFLAQEWNITDKYGARRRTVSLSLDKMGGTSSKFPDADIIVFNTGHLWTHRKTFEGKGYDREGTHVHSRPEVAEAYRKALWTWAQWVDANINSSRTRVFFCGYSAPHFRKGQWNPGERCDGEKKPITNDSQLAAYPWITSILESVLSEMKTPIFYLNITKMTDYRKDGHPSIYWRPEIQRTPQMIQDCSHWCLPGVPDSWNELLYATLLLSHNDFVNLRNS